MQTLKFLAQPTLSQQDLDQAAQLLRQGKLVAIPTETVYGLAADLFQEDAVATIFQLKGRPKNNPLIAHIAHLHQLRTLLEPLSPLFLRCAELFWPGPLTLIAHKHPSLSSAATAGLPTLAVRMPSHPAARQLIEAVGPLAAPSANLSGRPSPTTAEHVLEDFEGKLPALIDGGPCAYGIESTVLSLVGEQPLLLRVGAIAREEIEERLGMQVGNPDPRGALLSPGMRYRHYAPQAPLCLVETEAELQEQIALGAYIPLDLNIRNLYSQLRQADRQGARQIAILLTPAIRSNEVLMNRLEMAVHGCSPSHC